MFIHRKTKYRLLFSLISLSLGLNLNCHQSVRAEPGSGGMIYYNLGTQWLNTQSLNQSLTSSGYAKSNPLFISQGGGFSGMYQNYLVGLEYQSLFGQTVSKGQESLGISAHYGLLQLGYLLIATPRFQFYPYLGTGLGQLQIYSTESLSNVLNVSQGSSPHLGRIQGQTWLLDFGLGAHVILPMSPNNTKDARGPALGFRMGYLWQPLQAVWQHNELPMQGPQNLSTDGFYLRLQLGFGGYK